MREGNNEPLNNANTNGNRRCPLETVRALMRTPFAVSCVLIIVCNPAIGQQGGDPEMLDLLKKHADEYVAAEQPSIVVVGPASYLTIDGKGSPGGEAFRKRIGALYALGYSINAKMRSTGKFYTVGPLEGLYWGPDGKSDFTNVPRSEWRWKLMMRVPEYVTEKDVTAMAKRFKSQPGSVHGDIKLEKLAEGKCAQIMHVGPYSEETATIAKMIAHAKSKGLVPNGLHHEIYIDDPNRAAPEKLRTILRQPVK